MPYKFGVCENCNLAGECDNNQAPPCSKLVAKIPRCPNCGGETTLYTRENNKCWHCGVEWSGLEEEAMTETDTDTKKQIYALQHAVALLSDVITATARYTPAINDPYITERLAQAKKILLDSVKPPTT